jgi:hypothetical protein
VYTWHAWNREGTFRRHRRFDDRLVAPDRIALSHPEVTMRDAHWARLSPAGRADLIAAQRGALVTLRGELRVDPHASLVELAGLPRAVQSQVLVGAIEAKVAA